MKEQILENIYSLYKSHIVTAIILLALIVMTVIVTIGVIKLELIKSSKGKFVLIATVIVCSVFLITSQLVTIVPIYKDYCDSSYIVVEDANVVIKGDSTGVLDRLSTVSVRTRNGEFELNIQTDLKLDVDTEYVGTVVFLKHSKYIVWHDLK
jgi:hypothetical protein